MAATRFSANPGESSREQSAQRAVFHAASATPSVEQALALHELAAGGEAVGRLADGRVVFVPGGAPGEEAAVALTAVHRTYARAQLLRVLSPSPDRVVPPCPLAASAPAPNQDAPLADAACGGCPLMHVERAAQLRAKQEWVFRALRHSGAVVLPIQAPTSELGYRVRARLMVRQGQLSFASARSHRGVPIRRCVVLEPNLEAVLLGKGQAIAAALGEGGTLAGLLGGGQGTPAVHLSVQLAPGGRIGVVRTWLQRLLQEKHIGGAKLFAAMPADGSGEAEVFGEPAVNLAADGEPPLWAGADGFAQASAAGHHELPRLVAELVGAAADGGRWPRLIELYAGSGNFTRALQPLADHIVAIEGDAAAASRLRRLLERGSPASAAAVTVVAESAERALARLLREGERFDIAVLDPPRTGARSVLAALTRLAVRRVVYVSCDAMTLGRDLVELRAAGLRPRSVQPLDLMPHTAQVECVAVLDAD